MRFLIKPVLFIALIALIYVGLSLSSFLPPDFDLFKPQEIELEKTLREIKISGKHHEIQALFIEYDFYYHFFGDIYCFGKQEYPLLEEPRYISGEFDYKKQILFLGNGINFQPAWIDCQEFADLDYLDIDFNLQNLFQLHSRVLLHMALEKINLKNTMNFFQNRPFTFYINEHDCEVMTLYRLN